MANSPVFVIKRIFTLIGLYLIGVIIGGVLQFVGIFHVGSNVPDYIFPSLIFIPSVTLLFFSSLKKVCYFHSEFGCINGSIFNKL